MHPTVRRHPALMLVEPLTPLSISSTIPRHAVPESVRRADERQTQRVLAEAFARPTVIALADQSDDEADAVVALIRMMDQRPATFALKILTLEKRVAELEAKHDGLSARVGA